MKVLIIDEFHSDFLAVLKQNKNIELDYLPKLDAKEVSKLIKNYQGLVFRHKIQVDAKLLSQNPQLKFIARGGAGMDNIDEKAAKKQGITLLNAPEGNRDAVGEHVIGMLLMLFNKLNKANTEVNRKVWLREGNRGIELKGKTISLIGFGNNGAATAKKLSGFDCEVLAYDKYSSSFFNNQVKQSSLAEIFEKTDVLSLHVPLTKETKYLINQGFIDQFKKPFYLINISRGKVVCLADLKKALEEEKILGACLDVLEKENLDDLNPKENLIFDYLVSNPKVLFSPHVAGWTHESYQKIGSVLANKILNLIA